MSAPLRMSFSTYPLAPGQHGRSQRVVVVVRGQDQTGDLGVRGADVAAQVDAVAIGQSDVEHRDVRERRLDAPNSLAERARFADHGRSGSASTSWAIPRRTIS